jgi:DNA polymerase-3 subunit gamma/tau
MEDEAIDWEVYKYNLVGEIIEIDAASNNGVDNVRELRETCKFKPLTGGYKVYIIDEVHMLSTGAFNALLKTLEEPPAHAIFILCTTDPQKIPATILSRVQRFDFKRMTSQQIIDRLKHIIVGENEYATEHGCDSPYSVDDEAMEYIAKLANGGMRDSISLLDTCLGYQQELNAEDVANILGTANYKDYLIMLKKISDKDGAGIIEKLEELHLAGRDLKQFIKALAEFIVEIRKFGLLGNMEYCNVPAYLAGQVEKVTQVIPDATLKEIFQKLVNLHNSVKYETQPKALIEGELICL